MQVETKMSDIPLISIIIVNYNNREYLGECLNSIRNFVSQPYEVIVVDNASSDESCDYLRNYHSAVKVICNSENIGYSKSNNIGAKHAVGSLLLLLNSDTRLETSISPALNEFKDPRLGVVGCRLSYGDGRCQHSIGYEHSPLRIFLSWLGLGKYHLVPSIFSRVDNNELHYQHDQVSVAWVSGAFLMTRKQLWSDLDGLDERYFMYVEDVDYCKRVRNAGYRVAYTPDVRIVHYEGGGKEWIGSVALHNSMRSYLTYIGSYYGKFIAKIFGITLGFVMTARSCYFKCKSWMNGSPIFKEKELAYMNAARILTGLE